MIAITNNFDLKAGRQIVVWGRMDNIRVNDVLNPLDLRIPGLTDIEDLRLPVFMTRVDYYLANIALTGYLIHERRYRISHALRLRGTGFENASLFYFGRCRGSIQRSLRKTLLCCLALSLRDPA